MIKILPNIYLSTEFDVLDNSLETNSIDTVIVFVNNINNPTDTYKQDYIPEQNQFDKTVKHINQSYPINFDFLNNILLDYLTFSKNLLIVSKNNLYGFAVLGGFIGKNLKVSLIEILTLAKYHKINISGTQEYQQLLNFNELLKKIN